MKKLSLLSLAISVATLTACGGGDNSPDKPNLCMDVNVDRCDQIVIPESSSSSSTGPLQPPVNNILPFTENIDAANASVFFSAQYRALLNTDPADINPAFFYATSGLDEGRLAVENNKLTIGNARMTIGQGYVSVGTHLDPNAISAINYKVDTTSAIDAAQWKTTTTWGELDLTHKWKISFCVEDWEHTNSTANNQLFQLFIDNNTSGKAKSIHGDISELVKPNVNTFTKGKRIEINVPGIVTSGGVFIEEVLNNPGTTSSFLQIRVPSAANVTLSKLWMGYQDDTSTEPDAASCTVGEKVAGWNKPFPPIAPVAITVTPLSQSLRLVWDTAARASNYKVALNTVDDIATATIFSDITTATYTVAGLENGTTYYVWVKAANAQGESEWSTSFTGVPDVPATPPDVPTDLTVYGDNQRALVTWTATEGAESYSLAVNTQNNTDTADVTTGLTETFKRLTGLINDAPYYVFVNAGNTVGDSDYTAAQVVMPTASPYIYEANFAVTKDLFFGANGPAVQTLGVDSEIPMHFIAGGGAGITLEEGGIRLASGGRFTIGQVVAPDAEGVLVQVPTARADAGVNGVLDLSGYYKIVINVVSAPDNAGLFQVYLDNNSASGANSIHTSDSSSTRSRLINRAANTITDGEEIVFEMTADRRGTATSFIQLRTDSGIGAEGILISSIRIEEIDPPVGGSSSEASSSAASSIAPSSSPASSSVAVSSSAPSSIASSESSSSVSSTTGGGTSSVSSSSAASSGALILSENFATANDNNFFTNVYKAIPTDSSLPLYVATSGGSRISFADGELSMNNARFTIGDKGGATTSTTQPNGSYDLRTPYRIKFTITAAAGTGNIQVYVDNNTTSAGNSIHNSEGSTASRLIQIAVTDILSLPYELIIESDVGTATSFFQVRADSGVSNLTIDNLTIEYQ